MYPGFIIVMIFFIDDVLKLQCHVTSCAERNSEFNRLRGAKLLLEHLLLNFIILRARKNNLYLALDLFSFIAGECYFNRRGMILGYFNWGHFAMHGLAT